MSWRLIFKRKFCAIVKPAPASFQPLPRCNGLSEREVALALAANTQEHVEDDPASPYYDGVPIAATAEPIRYSNPSDASAKTLTHEIKN